MAAGSGGRRKAVSRGGGVAKAVSELLFLSLKQVSCDTEQ